MPGAGDPIEAAREDIAESRNLIAAVADDLNQHQRWLEKYRVAEVRRARRLKRQELNYRLQLKRRQLARSSKREALAVAREARAIYRTLAAATVATLAFLHRWTVVIAAWIAPRARAAGLFLLQVLRGALLWLGVQARLMGRALWRAASTAAAWTAVQARALARMLAEAASRAWSWTAREAPIVWSGIVERASAGMVSAGAAFRSIARALRKTLFFTLSWLRVEFDAARLAVANGASASGAWSARRARRGSVAGVRLTRQSKAFAGHARSLALASSASLLARTASGGRMLRQRLRVWMRRTSPGQYETPGAGEALPCRKPAIRRSTALICIEPWRPKLPAVILPPPSPPLRRPQTGAKPRQRSEPKPRRKHSRARGSRRRSKN
ncbi:MAG: hypothetical protein ACREDO_00265 [Methyloceanibacter sp.]